MTSPAIPGFGVNDLLKSAELLPNGRLALVYAKRPRLSLLTLSKGNRQAQLARWGNDVPLQGEPFEARFTADGRFAVVNDMHLPGQGTEVHGTVTSIAIEQDRASDGTPQHRIASSVRTGVLPEGLAISPDGRWVATTNLERSYYAANAAAAELALPADLTLPDGDAVQL